MPKPRKAKKTPPPPALKRDEDGKPKPKKWVVTITAVRTIEVEDVATAKEAEESARESAMFADEFPIDREEITEMTVGWVNPEPAADPNVIHLEGCYGHHCKHFDCCIDDGAIDHREYCSQCDVDAY